MHPARLCFLHPGLAVGLVVVDAPVVSKRGEGDDVDEDEEDENDNVDDGDLPPALLEAGQHPGFAGVTVVAELLLVVAPHPAVRVVSNQPSSRVPHRLVHVYVPALCWRLAASRL
ncbi:hypothetical protein U1Q18_033152 [Sarracenia purpurea var. burkii]